MATAVQVQYRRGTAAQTAAFTGAAGELSVETDNHRVIVHDDATAGGFPAAKLNDSNVAFTGGTINGLATLGVNATADATNKLFVASSAVLFNNIGTSIQVKLNKNAAGDTASFLYQTGFSGRAEIGLTGDDNFHFKVSPDGAAWTDALIINKTTGALTLAAALAVGQGGTGVTHVGTSVADPGSGTLEFLMPVQTVAAASYTFVAADLYKETRRSNSASAMTDTFPGSATTGLANGTTIQLNNVDASANLTVSAGSGTTVNGASSVVIGPGRSTRWVYDLASTNWRPTMNSLSAFIAVGETTLASASTTDIGASATEKVLISGTTTITSFGTMANKFRLLRFSGVLTLTYDATALILPGATSIITAAGDMAIATSDGSGNWRVRQYQRATGAGVRGANLQTFNASGTYTPTPGMTFCDAYISGGGGGGGGGAQVAASTAASGGGGGGGSSQIYGRFSAAQIGASRANTLAGAGVGGAAASTTSTNGSAGTGGGDSTFSSFLKARGGGGGAGGQIGTASGGGGGGGLNLAGGSVTGATGGSAGSGGGAGGSGAAGASPTQQMSGAGGAGSSSVGAAFSGNFAFGTGSSGGGSGGGFDAANTTKNGGTGAQNLGNGFNSGSAAGGTAGGTVAGASGSSYTGYSYGGGGGAGGASDLTAAGAGGTGGSPGGGGGGGGCAQNGGAPGKGGDGGAAVCYVVEWF